MSLLNDETKKKLKASFSEGKIQFSDKNRLVQDCLCLIYFYLTTKDSNVLHHLVALLQSYDGPVPPMLKNFDCGTKKKHEPTSPEQ